MNPFIMWNQILVPILLPLIVNCEFVNKTDDVFVAAGHAELERYSKKESPAFPAAAAVSTATAAEPAATTKEEFEYVTESVVFVPNSRGSDREDEREEEVLKVDDVMNYRTVDDVLNNKNFQVSETEAPQGDIFFVTGKNHDYTEKEEPKRSSRRKSDENKERKSKKKNENEIDCKNLDCANTIKGVCGAKYENSSWKYRVFMNECYFNKVNCQFKYEFNRYKQAPAYKCKDVGMRLLDHYYSASPKSSVVVKKNDERPAGLRSTSSRRSMSFTMNGQICSHPCPTTCTDDYDPQCAVSGTGQRRMFINHCKMDYNSCFYGVVWHKRPLAECVGGRKADMRQNRNFIGWMQRVGIVDKRGRLVME